MYKDKNGIKRYQMTFKSAGEALGLKYGRYVFRQHFIKTVSSETISSPVSFLCSDGSLPS